MHDAEENEDDPDSKFLSVNLLRTVKTLELSQTRAGLENSIHGYEAFS